MTLFFCLAAVSLMVALIIFWIGGEAAYKHGEADRNQPRYQPLKPREDSYQPQPHTPARPKYQSPPQKAREGVARSNYPVGGVDSTAVWTAVDVPTDACHSGGSYGGGDCGGGSYGGDSGGGGDCGGGGGCD